MKAEDKKIAVIGIGGVGGYIAAMLAKAYPHVTMVARGARGESIRKNGLVLHTLYPFLIQGIFLAVFYVFFYRPPKFPEFTASEPCPCCRQ